MSLPVSLPVPLPTKEISRVIQERFAAYESGDRGRVMGLYTEDAAYWDTKCPARMQGRAELSKYLSGFLGNFDLRYAMLEEHRLEGRDAAIVLWECAVRRRLPEGGLGTDLVMQRGMTLIEVRDGLISRDEAYMDLASLDPLLAQAAV